MPSEDSVSLGDKNPVAKEVTGNDSLVEIAVIKLPRISNFTDFEPLERSAIVRYVALGEPLGDMAKPATAAATEDLSRTENARRVR